MRPSTTAGTLRAFYEALLAAYGPQGWWPGRTRTEIVVGAVLTQNTNWKNVERAIDNLRAADCLDWAALRDVEPARLAELIRPAGYYNLKTRRLKNLVNWLWTEHDGDFDALTRVAPGELREQLLSINGVGPETADSILLYAGGLPTFVVDTYTARVLKRHAWIEPEADYHTIQEHFESGLPPDVPLYNDYHALLVRVGHLHCRKTPRCETCPLADLLPEGGMVELD